MVKQWVASKQFSRVDTTNQNVDNERAKRPHYQHFARDSESERSELMDITLF